MWFKYILWDNIKLLQWNQIEDDFFDCIYLDPPFNSNRNYKYENNSTNEEFIDTRWSWEYEERLNNLIPLLKKKLKKDWNLFFHISAEQSLIPHKVLSKYFQKIEPIFWKRAHGKNTVKQKLWAVIDIIYKASDKKSKFNLEYVPLDEKYFENSYSQKDEVWLYALWSLKHDKTRKWHMYQYEHNWTIYEMPYWWKIPQKKLEELISENRIHFSRSWTLYKKLYKHESKWKPLSNLRDDVSYITRTTQDVRLYPTQKPVSLLERIIKISTNEWDWILDPVWWSWTTGLAAVKNNRNCVLLDINPKAQEIWTRRIEQYIDEMNKNMWLFWID